MRTSQYWPGPHPLKIGAKIIMKVRDWKLGLSLFGAVYLRHLNNIYYISASAYFFLLFCSGILPVLSAPDLTSSVSNGSLVYPEQPITITCVTTNSQILAWESEDYIGGRSQIVFASSSQPDSTDTGRNGAFAILISVTTDDNGELVITSELLINITIRSKTSSVTCRNVDNGQTDSIVFLRTNESATELMYPNKTEICPEDRINVTCTARNTSIIQWSSRSLSNGQIHCIRSDPIRRNDTMGNTVVDIFTEYSAADISGNTVLTCSLSFVASKLPINEQLSLVCLNVDIGVREVATISLQTADHCTATTVSNTPPYGTGDGRSTGSVTVQTYSIFISLCLALMMAVM